MLQIVGYCACTKSNPPPSGFFYGRNRKEHWAYGRSASRATLRGKE
nr:MAG TPA: hypothetical protein [Caudoviricetes sp.]